MRRNTMTDDELIEFNTVDLSKPEQLLTREEIEAIFRASATLALIQ